MQYDNLIIIMHHSMNTYKGVEVLETNLSIRQYTIVVWQFNQNYAPFHEYV
jgi:hypothetical protein